MVLLCCLHQEHREPIVTESDDRVGVTAPPHDALREQAFDLKRLRAERGNKSYNAIKKRAVHLFGIEASLPPSTQSAAFNGKYVGLDKLMWLVRTLMSWDEYGDECDPPEYRDDRLTIWRTRWAAITESRTLSPSRPSKRIESADYRTKQAENGNQPLGDKEKVHQRSTEYSTVQPYPAGTLWEFSYKKTGFTQVEELVLYAELNGSTITDDHLPNEITAQALWRMWVTEYADSYHERWPDLYRPGEVHISWFVTRPTIDGIFEGAPHVRDWRTLPGVMDDFPMASVQEDSLTHYTHPVNAETKEPINWLRLRVLDLGWNSSAANKGGFIQEATGWKPSPLQPTVDVRALGAAAGLYVTPLKK